MSKTQTKPSVPSQTNVAVPATPKKVRALRVPMQVSLRQRLEAEAKATNATPADVIRRIIAEKFEITLEAPARGGKRVYETPEAKKAAQKERRATKADLVKKLLAEHAAKLQAQAA